MQDRNSRATESEVEPSTFRLTSATVYSLLVGLGGLGWLGYRIATDQETLGWLPILVFAGLSLLVQRSSFHFGSPSVHSLSGVIDMAAVLALGPTAGAVVAALSGLTYLELNALFWQKLSRRHLLELPLFNAGLKASMALLAGALFRTSTVSLPLGGGGLVPALTFDATLILAVCVVSLVWFALDHVGWGILDYLEGGMEQLRAFIQNAFPQALLVELMPLPSSLVVALVYTYLSWPVFVLLSLVIIAVAVLTRHWADSRYELVQRVAELSTIEQVGRAIVQAQLDVDDLCELMYEHASRIVDTTSFQLGLFEGDDYVSRLWMREGQRVPQRAFHLTQGAGLVNWLRDSQQPLLVRDLQKEVDSLPARPVHVSERPPRAALYVPLIAGETVIGAMSIQSFRRNAYGESDLRVLTAMANQAAVSIQKAQLYAQERKRARQLETIGQISRQINATAELDEVFERIVHLICQNFGYYHVSIYTAEREQEVVTFQASASAGERDVAPEVAWGQGLIGWVAAQGQAVIINDVENDTRYRCVPALEETRSELAVPLLLEDELVGVLDMQSTQLDAFGPDDLFISKTMGDQIAHAMQEARLHEAERQQAWFSTALLQVADVSSKVSDLDAVLATIVRLTPLLVGVDRCAVLLWGQEVEAFIPAQTYGLPAELRETFEAMRLPAGAVPALDLVRWGKRHLLVNTARDRSLIPPEMVETFDIQEMVVLPLLAQGELLGVMLVDYAGKAHPFTERMIDMVSGIANQAAMVIHSARLVQAQQEEAYVSMALLQVAEAVSRSNDLEETLGTIARITPMLSGAQRCAIFLRDRDTSSFFPVQQYGWTREEEATFWQVRLEKDAPLARGIVAGEPFVASRELTASLPVALASGESALLALPLATKGEVVGGMIVDYIELAQRSTQRWMNILTGIANQAAIAVENSRLLQEAEEQTRMKQELDVARRIQTSFLPERCPAIQGWDLAAIWRSAREVGGDFYDFIPLPPRVGQGGMEGPRNGVIIADVADKGVPAALFMALCRTLVRTVSIDGRPPGEAIGRANDLILADARSGLFVTLFYAILHSDSAEISFVNAGHMPPVVMRAGDGTAEELRTGGLALGVLPNVEYEQRTTRLAPGDLLVLYTDGVTDAINSSEQMFGRERLIEMIRTHRDQSAEELAQVISDAVADFAGGAAQFDDFTLVVARRTA
ncbi:GAF domain-containing protein [Chloroflexota bacterium]